MVLVLGIAVRWAKQPPVSYAIGRADARISRQNSGVSISVRISGAGRCICSLIRGGLP